jgi:hypothetical protein
MAFGIAGCQSDGGSLNPFRSTPADAPPPPSTKVSASELLAYCPRVTLREGTAFYTTYANVAKKKKPAAEDALDASVEEDRSGSVVYQASISDVTRACTPNGGMLNINVAVAGKIVPGPMGKAGTITMPIRVAVLQGGEVVYSNLARFPVTVSDTSGATQFVYNDANISIPTPTERNVQIFAGYDEGPPAKKAR